MPSLGLRSRYMARSNRKSAESSVRFRCEGRGNTRRRQVPNCAATGGQKTAVAPDDAYDQEAAVRGARVRHREAFHCAGNDEGNEDHTARSDVPLMTGPSVLRTPGTGPDVQKDSYEKQSDRIIKKREAYRDYIILKLIPQRQRALDELGKTNDDGDEETDLTQEEADSIDEDSLMKEYAKRQIMTSLSNTEILHNAECLIEEDWLDKIESLPGNLFCLGAFGDILPDDSGHDSADVVKAYAKYIGCGLIILIQFFGPVLIFLSKMPGNVGVLDENKFQWRCWPLLEFTGMYDSSDTEPCTGGLLPKDVRLVEDWHHVSTTRALGLVLMLAFIMNGLFVIMEEKKAWKDIYNTFRFLDWKNKSFVMSGQKYLAMGAFINCWVVAWSCLDMYVIVGASDSPASLLMDALGLLFLYNLDDIGGDLGFIDEDDWPGLRIAWIYKELVHPWPDEEFDEDILDCLGSVCIFWYNLTILVVMFAVMVIPVLCVITPFTQIAPHG